MRPVEPWFCLIVASIVNTITPSVIPKPQHNVRTIDKPLSEEVHFDGDDKSQHNIEFDHDAFLGKDEAKSFDQLDPDESRRRLGIIYDKIDNNADGRVSEVELQQWIKRVQKRYVETETERQWVEHMTNKDETEVHWRNYLRRTYGTTEEEMAYENRDDPKFDENENENKVPIARDKRRWEAADLDKNGHLSREEFMYFLHPEEADHMKDIVIQETLEDIDKDHDGFISLQEYMDDTVGDDDDEENDPEWMAEEQEDFREELDKDGDGKLNKDEIAQWVIPNDYDHSHEETQHLLTEADSDKDGFLSKSEVIDKYELFVGSQATDYGEALTKHDEF